MTPLEILRGADKRLSHPNAWCKGDLLSGNRCCLFGALQFAVTGSALLDCPVREQTQFNLALSALAREVGHVTTFNDDSTTTFKDVKAALKRAIKSGKSRKVE